jgi:hypothetical protein
MDETRLYLVRIWHGQQRFRASVRRVDDETRHVFDTPEAVAGYLSSQAATSQEAPATPRDALVSSRRAR